MKSFKLLSTTALVASLSIAVHVSARNNDNLFENPFNKGSYHHMPIGKGARFAADSHPMQRIWNGKPGGIRFNGGFENGRDVYQIDDSMAPRVASFHRQTTVEKGRPFAPVSVPWPSELVNDGTFDYPTDKFGNRRSNFDGNMVFMRPTGVGMQFRQFLWPQGAPAPTASYFYPGIDVRGLGHGLKAGERVGSSAAGVNVLFGLIRAADFDNGRDDFGHGLQLVLPRTVGSGYRMLGKTYMLPATDMDRGAELDNIAGGIPYGSAWAIPSNVKMPPGLTAWGRKLFLTLQRYGAYPVDGGGSLAIRCDQGVDVDSLNHDGVIIKNLMRMITNHSYTQDRVLNTVGGGLPVDGSNNTAYDAP